jgi:DNA repair exonuclease SbcCD nuclease subunit
MNILAIGDPHFTPKDSIKIQKFTQEIVNIIQKFPLNFLVILGDMLHTHEKVHTTALNYAYDFLRAITKLIPVYILVGNHDYINNSQFLSTQHWMNGLKEWDNITVVDKVIRLKMDIFNFIFCPYVPVKRFEEALNTVEDWKNSNIIFAHQEFRGCEMATIKSIEGDEWSEEYPFVVSGHIHGRHYVGKNIYYPGTPYQTRFGESVKKGVTMITFENLKVKIKNIILNMPRKEIIKVELKGLTSFDLKKENNVEYKIEVKGSVDEIKVFMKSKLHENMKSYGKVVFKLNDKKKEFIPKNVSKNDNFETILDKLVKEQNDIELNKVYEEIMKKKECYNIELELEGDEDVLII